MKPEIRPVPSFEFLAEPALVVRRDGCILGVNGAARRLFAGDPAGSSLFTYLLDPGDELDALLRRASASTSPTIGAISLDTAGSPAKFRLHAARLAEGSEGPMLLLRLMAVNADQFALLTRRVRELDRQLRQRLQEKAALEEALRLNRTLLDELQHRVKNNIQMMMTLIRMSAQGKQGAEIVATAQLRLQAMASTQEAVYRSTEAGSVRSGDFLRGLVGAIGESAGFGAALEVEIEDLELDSEQAHCVALIVNELVTNAGKHALRDGAGRIRVSLARDASGSVSLAVEDDGPGMPETAGKRSSGLHLVRSLCRQIGGTLEITGGPGTLCQVRFERAKEGKP